MRLTALFLLATSLHLSARVSSQTISFSGKEMSLKRVFQEIRKQTGLYIVYNKQLIRNAAPLDLNVSNKPVSEVLDLVLRNQPLSYSIKYNNILIYYSSDKRPAVPRALSFSYAYPITGIIRGTDGQALPTINVVAKNSSKGASTNQSGTFSLDVVGDDSLVISGVGFVTKTVAVAGRKTIELTLETDQKALGEVVVVAYGTQKKETVTGAISSIHTREIKQSPAANLAVTLAGRLPGLTAIQTSGEPGRDATLLYLRGQGTINGQNPLIMVDGVPRDITYIDPNEVETISILKDASSTAMFGVRGANGVILVTTKRGTNAKTQINFTAESGLTSFTTHPSHVNAYQYATLRNQAGVNDGLGPNYFYTDAAVQHYKNHDDPIAYPDNDWPNLLMHKYVPQTRYDMNLSGGGEYVQYFVNAGYLHQGGQWKTNQNEYDPSAFLNRYNFRSNIDVSLTKDKSLKAFLNVAGYVEKVNSPATTTAASDGQISSLLSNVWSMPAVQPGPLTPDGDIITIPSLGSTGYSMINRSGYEQEERNNVTASFGMQQDLKFITPGLSARFMISFDTRSVYDLRATQNSAKFIQVVDPTLKGVNGLDSVSYVPYGSDVTTPLSTNTNTTFQSYSNFQFFVNYDRTFGKHSLKGLLLAQKDQRIQPGDRLPFNLQGFSSRVSYGFEDKYFVEFNAGYNGSEQFAKGHRYGFFPAISGAWVASNEDLLKGSSTFSLLKLRASYGEVGNDQLSGQRFLYLDNIGLAPYPNGYFGNVGRGQTVNEYANGNPDLSWEIAKKTNVGLDLGLWNHLNLAVDVFREHRDNMLINRQTIPQLNGFTGSLPPLNLGRMENHGFELELGYTKSFNKNLSVTSKVNFNYAKNKVEFLDEPKRTADYPYRYRQTGYSYGQRFGYIADGYWNSQEEIAHSGLSFVGIQPRPGDLKYKDLNGDKIVDDRDQGPVGNTNVPQYTYGAAFSINYKSFDVSVLFQGVAKVSNYFTGWGVYENNIISVYRSRMRDAWTAERQAAGLPIKFPALSTASSSSESVNNSFFDENTSYLRLKNVEIGYTLPLRWSSKIGSDKLRIYTNGLNIITWTKMKNKDFDPEVAYSLQYPINRIFNFGVNVVF